jgi:hypothetical protein
VENTVAIVKAEVAVGKATTGDLKDHSGVTTGWHNNTNVEWQGLHITIDAEPFNSVDGAGPRVSVTLLDEHGKATPTTWAGTGAPWKQGSTSLTLPDGAPGMAIPHGGAIAITVDLGTGVSVTNLTVTIEGIDANGFPIS